MQITEVIWASRKVKSMVWLDCTCDANVNREGYVRAFEYVKMADEADALAMFSFLLLGLWLIRQSCQVQSNNRRDPNVYGFEESFNAFKTTSGGISKKLQLGNGEYYLW